MDTSFKLDINKTHLFGPDNEIFDGIKLYKVNEMKEFRCYVAFITGIDLELTIDLNDTEHRIYSHIDNKILYETLYNDIKTEADYLPPIAGVIDNKACLALYEDDQQWYRALILAYEETTGLVTVKYVDYGNIAEIPVSFLKEIPVLWTKVPPQTFTAKLYGIRVNTEFDFNTLDEAKFNKTFSEPEYIKCKVIYRQDNISHVELKDYNGNLLYNNLINIGVFLKLYPKQLPPHSYYYIDE